MAKESPTSFAPEAPSHRGYHPNFGNYTLPIPPTPESQLMPGKTYLPTANLSLSSFDPQISTHHTLHPVDPSAHISPSPAPSSPINWSPSPPLAPRQLPSAPITTPLLPSPPSIRVPAPFENTGPNSSATAETLSGNLGNRGQIRRGRATSRGHTRGRGGRNNARNGTPTSNADDTPQPQEEYETTRNKKGHNRGMNAQEKLVLIRECCEHSDEYRGGTKTVFWTMIRELLKERTRYDLAEPRNTVLRWVKARIDELVEEEMGSGTQVDQDDFKAAVELFKDRLEAVEAEIKQSKKTKEAQAAELFEAARLQRAQFLSWMMILLAWIQKALMCEVHQFL